MKRFFIFSLIIFSTTIFLGPIFYFGWLAITGESTVRDVMDGLFYAIPGAAVLYLPSWFLLVFISKLLTNSEASTVLKKSLLSLIGSLLILLPVILFSIHYITNSNYWPAFIPMYLSYYLGFIVSIWIYKIPKNSIDDFNPSGSTIENHEAGEQEV